MSATSRQLAMVCSAFVSMTSEEKWIEGKRERRERERESADSTDAYE
jgi:hypothetical protein